MWELEENAVKSWGKRIVIIPARMKSKRLPGKPLLMADGQALVHWTYAQAKRTCADHVIVATPDREIAKYCQKNDLLWMATKDDHPNGTSRCWEIVERSKAEFSRVVNWQCDEPCVNPADVDMLLNSYVDHVGTLVTRSCSTREKADRNVTKVVYSLDGSFSRCFWFTRSPIEGAGVHVGVYSFVPYMLKGIGERMKEPSVHAKREGLEQLTWIEKGVWVEPFVVEETPLSVNTADDWKRFRRLVEVG